MASYKLVESRFRRRLDLIGDAIGPSAPLRIQGRSDLAQPPEGVALTFDDGGRSGVDRIAALLKERGRRADFLLRQDFIDEPGFTSAADLRRLHAGGHVVGTHSASHPRR
jgi:peptidoglycan/xylan/chitin deacetylase (PgdA/CDA1 family)